MYCSLTKQRIPVPSRTVARLKQRCWSTHAVRTVALPGSLSVLQHTVIAQHPTSHKKPAQQSPSRG